MKMPAPTKRSCTQCRFAKARCNLTLPNCSRCLLRGLPCTYQRTQLLAGKSNSKIQAAQSPAAGPHTTFAPAMTLDIPQQVQLDASVADLGHLEEPVFDATTSSWAEYSLPEDGMTYLVENDQRALPTTASLSEQIDPLPIISTANEELNITTAPRTKAVDISSPWFEQFLEHESHQPDIWSQFMPDPASSRSNNKSGNAIGLFESNQSPRRITSMSPLRSIILDQHPQTYPNLFTHRKMMPTGASVTAKYIVGSMKKYPAMLLGDSALPPFIHIRFMLGESSCSCDGGPMQGQFPTPLANCASLVHMHRNMSSASSPFVWRTIFAEAQRLYTEVCPQFSPTMCPVLSIIGRYNLFTVCFVKNFSHEFVCLRRIC